MRRRQGSRLQWLYPGLGVKRRVLAVVAGAALVAYAVWLAAGLLVSADLRDDVGGAWIGAHTSLAAALAIACLAAGLLVLFEGTRSLYRFARRAGEPGVVALRDDARLARGPRVVAVGGGTGLSALLSGLKEHSSNLTAIVTVADDGGSSGLLRKGLGVLPPGDIRNCLVALADDESLMSRLFQYRFPEDGGLQGHSFGNLFVAALAEVTGDFERAVRESTRVLKVRGQVLPATLDNVTLHAEMQGGERVAGESTITASDNLPLRVWLEPAEPRALRQALEALVAADLVVLGPGSVFTSIVPNLLIPQVREAVHRTPARVVYVCNVMTQPGETDGFTAADHLRALYRHGATGLIDDVLVNDTPVSDDLAATYLREGAVPVVADDRELEALGVRVVHARLAAQGDFVRHDPESLAAALLPLAAPDLVRL
ncbi:MAG TPA: YvcK family protein [Thermoleophilia bacterium]|nr:YvcK family protein [Thermoleophilia bacterium]